MGGFTCEGEGTKRAKKLTQGWLDSFGTIGQGEEASGCVRGGGSLARNGRSTRNGRKVRSTAPKPKAAASMSTYTGPVGQCVNR